MRGLRSAYLWHGLAGALLIAMLATRGPIASSALLFLAAAGWVYVFWRLMTLWRRPAVVPAGPIDRSPRSAPTVTGAISAGSADVPIDPDEMKRFLDSVVIGQPHVSDQLARGIFRRTAQQRRGKPVFTALLSGPTGTGKTEMAKAVAEYLYGDAKTMFRVDCANVLGEAGLQTLIGSPKGYAGSSSWGALTAHLRATPRTVILFDEIEKAVMSATSPMAKLLLSLLDEGICTEQSDGTRVSANEAVILLTSNAAQERLGSIFAQFQDQPDQLVRATKDALRDHFAPEFLGRIDLVTTFAPLDDAARARIIAMHTGLVGRSYGVEISSVDASFVNEALRLWTTLEGYGTREVIRWIEEAISDEVIQARKSRRTDVRIFWADGQAKVDGP